MILSDSKILEALKNGDIVIDPFDRKRLNAHSYDVTLGNTFKMYAPPTYRDCTAAIMASEKWDGAPVPMLYRMGVDYIDSKEDNPLVELAIPEEGLVLIPQNFYLMHTVERVNSCKYAPRLDGKSSGGRLSLKNHFTAGYGDVGFSGAYWTLEVEVSVPLKIYPGMPIGQIEFHVIDGEILQKYDENPESKYNGKNMAQGSMMYKNFKQ